MFDDVSAEIARDCLAALAQLAQEGDDAAILSFAQGVAEAGETPATEIMLQGLAQIGKMKAK